MKVVTDFGITDRKSMKTWKDLYRWLYNRKLYVWDKYSSGDNWAILNMPGVLSASSNSDSEDKVFAFVTSDHQLFTYGTDSRRRHGHPEDNVLEPRLVSGISAKYVSCGGALTGVITTDNRLVLMGVQFPVPTYMPNKSVIKVSCSYGNCCYVTSNNHLYGLGDAGEGQLGIPIDKILPKDRVGLVFDSDAFVIFPQLMKGRVRDVSCGNGFMACISITNRMYLLTPDQPWRRVARDVDRVSCGSEHLLFTDTSKNLYGLMDNSQQQLLLDGPEHMRKKTFIAADIVTFDCGGYASVAIDSAGRFMTNVKELTEIRNLTNDIYSMNVDDTSAVFIGAPIEKMEGDTRSRRSRRSRAGKYDDTDDEDDETYHDDEFSEEYYSEEYYSDDDSYR
jgi:alpha-tubulin suppressor-like RCC1 family protein